jgi:hypothetical protein
MALLLNPLLLHTPRSLYTMVTRIAPPALLIYSTPSFGPCTHSSFTLRSRSVSIALMLAAVPQLLDTFIGVVRTLTLSPARRRRTHTYPIASFLMWLLLLASCAHSLYRQLSDVAAVPHLLRLHLDSTLVDALVVSVHGVSCKYSNGVARAERDPHALTHSQREREREERREEREREKSPPPPHSSTTETLSGTNQAGGRRKCHIAPAHSTHSNPLCLVCV